MPAAANLPAAHGSHSAAPSTPVIEPAAHGTHAVAPEFWAYVPAPHAVHDAPRPSAEKRPLAHVGHEPAPPGQAMHDAAAMLLHVPPAHAEHVVACAAENSPAAQGVQLDTPDEAP